jgi:hypothetical protein
MALSHVAASLRLRAVHASTNELERSSPTLFDHAVGVSSVGFAAGQLLEPRGGHTATLLRDGRVLIAGGENATGPLAAAEVFDPASGSSTLAASLDTPRSEHTATLLSDGRVMIAGGRTGSGPLRTTEIFDPATARFIAGPDLNFARAGHSATHLSDGRIVLVGGDAAGSLEIYDPEAYAWAPVAAGLIAQRAFHSAALLNDENVLIVGGTASDGVALLSGEIFNLANSTVLPVGNQIHDARTRPLLRVLPDGKVQIIGGTDHESIELYDPTLNAFGAHAHVYPSGDSHPELLDEILAAPTRAALFYPGAPGELLARSGQTITELPESHQALITGGVNSKGTFLNAVTTLNSSTATVTTDRLDYAPGTPVLVSGTGWQPYETVTLQFHEDPHVATENPHTFVVTADVQGRFLCREYAPEALDNGTAFILAATSSSSRQTAQTVFTDSDPAPRSLPYSQDFSTLLHSATTYPAGWQGWQLAATGSSTSFRTTAAIADVALTANSGASSSGGGVHNFNGKIGMLATGTIDPSVALAINTTGQTNVNVAFDIMTIRNPHDGAGNTRINQVDFQYRVGTVGSFVSLSGLATGIYQNNTTTQTGSGVTTPQKLESKNFSLPGAADNQPVVQLRWVQRDVSGGGARPSFAVDNLAVTASPLTPPTLQFTAANFPDLENNSGSHTKTVTVQRTGAATGAVEVNYATSDGSANLSDNDYVAAAGTLHWNDGDTSDKSFTITVKGDTTFEPDETVNLTLASPTGGAVIGATNSAALTIQNDDALPAISIADVSHSEGDSGTTLYAFTVSLSNASYQTVMVDYATADGTATAPADYLAVSGTTLAFLPGETSRQVNISSAGDLTFEADEQFFVNLDKANNALIADGQATGTIQNDDSQPTISIANQSQNEGDSDTTEFGFAVTLSNPSDQSVTVHFNTTDGTATDTEDYLAATGTLTFMPGDTAKLISVSVNGDTRFESDESFTVNLDAPSAAVILDGTALATIKNDDSRPTVQFALTSSAGAESSSPVELEVNLTNDSFETVTVPYSVHLASTATGGGADYTLLGSGTLSFSPGDKSGSISFTVVDDSLDEFDETLLVDLSAATNATLGAPATHAYTIQDNDAEPDVAFAAANSTASEATTPVVLAATLSAPSAKTITVNYAASGASTANASGVDYTLAPGILTFNPGETSQDVSLTVNDDNLDENDEQVVIDLATPVNATLGGFATHAYTIQDNDAAPFFAISDVSLAEGNSGTTDFVFTVTKSGPTELTSAVNYATANGIVSPATGGGACGAALDYEGTSGTLTFAPADTSLNVTVKICGDTLGEPAENFVLNLFGATNAVISDGQGAGAINNDDSASSYSFTGFFAPVDQLPIFNTVKPGSAVPIKWRLLHASALPVSDPASFAGLFSYQINCATSDSLESPVETVAPGGSGLQYLGEGNWQLNWKTLTAYPRGSCRLLELRLSDGTSHYANFKFK